MSSLRIFSSSSGRALLNLVELVMVCGVDLSQLSLQLLLPLFLSVVTFLRKPHQLVAVFGYVPRVESLSSFSFPRVALLFRVRRRERTSAAKLS